MDVLRVAAVVNAGERAAEKELPLLPPPAEATPAEAAAAKPRKTERLTGGALARAKCIAAAVGVAARWWCWFRRAY